MAGVGLTPSRAMAAEDIRDLQGRTSHKRTGRATGSGRHAGASCFAGFKLSRSSGLVTSRIVLTATRV
jgi:hypothetical protein